MLPTRFVPPHASPSSGFNERVSYPCPFNFPHPRFKAWYFPQLKKHKFPIEEKGGIVSTMVLIPTTKWAQGLFGPELTWLAMRSDPSSPTILKPGGGGGGGGGVGTTRQENACLLKPGCLLKGQLQGGPSRVLSLLA